MSRIALVLLLLGSLPAAPVLALLAMPPAPAGPRLVLHPPWLHGPALVRAAGGSPLTGAPLALLAYAPDPPAFDRRLRTLGAWAIVDGTALAGLCGTPAPTL